MKCFIHPLNEKITERVADRIARTRGPLSCESNVPTYQLDTAPRPAPRPGTEKKPYLRWWLIAQTFPVARTNFEWSVRSANLHREDIFRQQLGRGPFVCGGPF
ncbi:hypothetical protein EVAR_44084_1 [Eumeta japonica]|uniref:Uncharacterized protein n=1 Tax=Eumeta variegata TaxID=151549 RepID=A0A4C1X4P4_EUMVA|nr:hypothetical protein EVAR_44084_1 [Eumeta japonica]